MKVATFAPHLVGRMLPGIFTYLGVGKVARFPGDPWPLQNSAPTWYWMHATGCTAGLYRSRPMKRAPFPADLDELFASMPAEQPDQPRAAALQSSLFPEAA